MTIDKNLCGKYICLSSVNIGDAMTTLSMRQNKDKTRFLHDVDNDIKKQEEWIRKQNNSPNDYFFLVKDLNGTAKGTVGVYEIDKNRGHIGRLLMYGNAFESFESYLLLLDFCFDTLKLDEVWGDTDIENRSAIKFSKMFGLVYSDPEYDNEMDRYVCYCRMNKKEYNKARGSIVKLIYRKDKMK